MANAFLQVKLDGKNILQGGCKQPGYENWIEIDTYEFSISTVFRSDSRSRFFVPNFNYISEYRTAVETLTIEKGVDIASPMLMQYCSEVHEFPEVNLALTASKNLKEGNQRQNKYLELLLKKVRISSFEFSLAADAPTETIELSVGSIEMSAYQEGKRGEHAIVQNAETGTLAKDPAAEAKDDAAEAKEKAAEASNEAKRTSKGLEDVERRLDDIEKNLKKLQK